MSVTVTRDNGDWIVQAEQMLPRPVDEVFPFFADAYNLETITPDFLKFHVVTPRPIDMREGALIDYKLKVRGLPIRWRTRIEAWDPPHRFVDVQLKGPYRKWHHTHSFEPTPDGGTLVRDVVRYRPIGGAIVNKLFVQRDVVGIFEHRQRVLAERFMSPPTT